jgi:UDP-N-acetyl-D-mannosaminuronic acid dehydrogenase
MFTVSGLEAASRMGTDMEYEKICVIGLGYIGLPTAALLAAKGHPVRGVDVKREAVDTINQGRIHIKEPDLDVLVKAAVQSGNLTAHLEPAGADVFMIAVPTPFKAGHKPDMAHVENAARAIAPFVKAGDLVILESTSPVGSTEDIARIITAARPDLGGEKLYFAHCPERVLPGQILKELVGNDRVTGGVDAESTKKAAEFYRGFVSGEVFETDARTAEMCKLTENSYRDVNIAFANELSMICDDLAIDVWELIRLANRHPRVKILQPGPGVGGHCIAVDPWFIVDKSPEKARLIRSAREVNDLKPEWVVEKVLASAAAFRSEKGREPRVSAYGLAFKADVDDLRESPAIRVVRALAGRLATVHVYEPHVTRLPGDLKDCRNVVLEKDDGRVAGDIIVILVNHSRLRTSELASGAVLIEVCHSGERPKTGTGRN